MSYEKTFVDFVEDYKREFVAINSVDINFPYFSSFEEHLKTYKKIFKSDEYDNTEFSIKYLREYKF